MLADPAFDRGSKAPTPHMPTPGDCFRICRTEPGLTPDIRTSPARCDHVSPGVPHKNWPSVKSLIPPKTGPPYLQFRKEHPDPPWSWRHRVAWAKQLTPPLRGYTSERDTSALMRARRLRFKGSFKRRRCRCNKVGKKPAVAGPHNQATTRWPTAPTPSLSSWLAATSVRNHQLPNMGRFVKMWGDSVDLAL